MNTKFIIEYYDYTMPFMRILWHGTTYAIHHGLWDENTKRHKDALLNANRFLAERASITKDCYVLDAGCGIGGTALWLAREYGAQVVGITLSEKQARKARMLAQKYQLTDLLSFEVKDYCNTRYPDETFDVVWALESVCYASEKEAFLRESHRILKIGVINLQGRIFMNPIDCPFQAVKREIEKLKQETNIIFVDFHAEATSEKIAMGWYLNGEVSAVFGTHTHVVTADERILPKGTAYITDIGMTGAADSVIGRGAESVIKSFRTRMPVPFEIATGNVKMNGILVIIDSSTKNAERIERICISAEQEDTTRYDSDDGKPEYLNNNL